MSRRVVVTGLGASTPIGTGVEKFWQGLLDCQSGANVIEAFDTEAFQVHIGAEVKDFDAAEYLGGKAARTLDRFIQFALVSADQSVADSGLDFEKEDVTRVGCIWASGIGGLREMEATHHVYLDRGPRRISPYFIPKLMINAASGQIAIRFAIQGVNFAVASACASAQHAIGLAFRSIKHGESDVMITGGSEAAITGDGTQVLQGGHCGWGGQFASEPGYGAPGLYVEERSQVRVSGVDCQGGFGPSSWVQDQFATAGSVIEEPAPADPTMEFLGDPIPGQTLTMRVTGPQGGNVRYLLGRIPEINYLVGGFGPDLLVEIRVVNPGVIPASGVRDYNFVLPGNLPQGMYFLGQAKVVYQGTTFRTPSQVLLVQ